MIEKEEVKHIASLARLGLSDKEINKFQKELSSILDYIEKLKKLDVSGKEATSHPLSVKNETREDVGRKFADNDKLIDLAPDKKGKHFKVKTILK